MFFAINNNEFIHKKSNPIIIEKLNQLRIEEIEIFWQSLTNFIKIIKQLKVLSECFILNNFKREFYNAFNCNGKISNFVICEECHKIVKTGHESRHIKLCKNRICGFRQIDGHACNSFVHTKKLHLDFFPFDYIIKDYAIETNVLKELQNNLIESEINSIIIHSNEIQNTISCITDNFKNQFRILVKKCNCLNVSKYCNCFLHIINNADSNMYFKRKRKNVYYGIKDLICKRKKILGIINVNYKAKDIKYSKQFDFFQNIRKSKQFKLIFMVDNEINSKLITQNVFKKQNISYRHLDMISLN